MPIAGLSSPWFSGASVVTNIAGSITNPISSPPTYSFGSSTLFNYVRTLVPQTPCVNDASVTESSSPLNLPMSTTYFDGFERKLQRIVRNCSPTSDLVTPFDNRADKDHFSYSPYPISTAITNSVQLTPFADQASYYNGLFPAEPGMALSENSYSSDAASRVKYKFAAGKSNIGQKNGIRTTTISNTTNEVIIWEMNVSTGMPQKIGYYAPGTLMKTVIEDADGGQKFEYYDNEGKLIAKNILAGFNDCNLTATNATVGSLVAFRMYNPMQNAVLIPNSETTHSSEANLSRDFAKREIPINHFTPFKCPTYLLTYYVYDIYNRLTCTLPPKAVQYLSANSWVMNSNIFDNLCDYNIYDNFGRVVESHLAGEKGNNLNIYDNHNRLVMSSRPNDQEWWWNHYDALGRIVQTGTLNFGAGVLYPRSAIQYWFDNSALPAYYNTSDKILYYLYNETQQGVYPSVTLASGNTINAWNFYDDYSHASFDDGTASYMMTLPGYDAGIYGSYLATNTTAVAPVQSDRTLGMITASVSRIIKSSSSIVGLSSFVYNNMYYDDRGRLIQQVEMNSRGGINKFANQYNFGGKVLLGIEQVNNPTCSTNATTKSVTQYQYNPYTQNLQQITNSINGALSRTIASYSYDDLGQLIKKGIGGIEDQQLTYNIRGQLTGINPDFAENGDDHGFSVTFGESIKYDAGFTNSRFCGGISGTIWKDKGYPSRAYGYTYDNAGRLKQADFREYTGIPMLGGGYSSLSWNTTYTNYTEGKYNYDWNGNLTTLERYGPLLSYSSIIPGKIDDLTYVYDNGDISNQVLKVDDAIASSLTTTTPYDFKNNNSSDDFSYDNNGALKEDKNKSLVSLYTNHFGKPQYRVFTNGDVIECSYDASGNKIEELYTTAGASGAVTTTDYIGNFIFEKVSTSGVGSTLQLINNSEGYVVPAGTGFNYFYYVRDHLGNVRNVQNCITINTATDPGNPIDPPVVFHHYFAGHEPIFASEEQAVFSNIPLVRDDKPQSIDQSDLKSARLDASDENRIIGTTLMLKVMPGDRYSFTAETYYSSIESSTGTINGSALSSALLTTLTGGSGGIANGEPGQITTIQGLINSGNIGAIDAIQASGEIDNSRPLTFINYILYDDNFRIIPGQSGSIQIGAGADGWQTIGTESPISVNASGYLILFMSTSSAGISSFIDRFSIYHYKGNTQDIKHYYPFGLATTLSMPATFSSTYPFENRYLFQTKEYDKREDLYLNDFNARQYDPQLGRFLSIDPHNQFSSPYTGMGNNPIAGIDPNGKDYYYGVDGDGNYQVAWWADQYASTVYQGGTEWTHAGATADLYGTIPNGITFYYSNGVLSVSNPEYEITTTAKDHVWYGRKTPEEVAAVQQFADGMEKSMLYGTVGVSGLLAGPGVASASITYTSEWIAGLTASLSSNAVAASYTAATTSLTALVSEQNAVIEELNAEVQTAVDKILGESTSLINSQYALHSGAGTAEAAMENGFMTLGNTAAGKNLELLQRSMGGIFNDETYDQWARLSTAWVNQIPNGSRVAAFLNSPSEESIFLRIEVPLALSKNITIVPVYLPPTTPNLWFFH